MVNIVAENILFFKRIELLFKDTISKMNSTQSLQTNLKVKMVEMMVY